MTRSSTAERQTDRRRVIERPRLTRMLDETTARIILLTAPAGYGKTTLARQWLAERPHAWYRGTPASADVAALALGLAVAAGEIVPGAEDRLRERLRATNHPEQETDVLAELLAEDLDEWPSEAWLAIDDYQFAMEAEAPERFIERLLELTSLRLLVASRNRPTWATARRILYGEIFELERDPLAMSDDEAGEVLAHRGEHVPALVERAEGWPAVIGLAALTESLKLPEDNLPATLYEYFAEEVYLQAEPAVRWGLCQLSIAPTITTELVRLLFGEETGSLIVQRGVDLGVLSTETRGRYSLHPLLRSFLVTKLNEQLGDQTEGALARVFRFLLAQKDWDAAYVLAQRFGPPSLLIPLLEAALPEILEGGRLTTLKQWASYAREHDVEGPLLDLAEAELLFREGLLLPAQRLALRAAKALAPAHPLTARAYSRAGQCANLSNREDLALDLHKRARQAARNQDELREAVIGEFHAALDLERDDVQDIARELEGLYDESPVTALRIASVQLIHAIRRGGLTEALRAAELAARFVPRVRDPLVRASFLHIWANCHAISGQYYRALELVKHASADARRYRLGFSLPHMYITGAVSELGMRHFHGAMSYLERAERAATHVGDLHILANVWSVTARWHIARTEFDSALEELDRDLGSISNRTTRGELLATRALAVACGTDHASTEEIVLQVEQTTISSEAMTLARCARAIAALQRSMDECQTLAQCALDAVLLTGCADGFVTAYRGYPPLLFSLAQSAQNRASLVEITSLAHDGDLASVAGLPKVPPRRGPQSLTRREREVYGLLLDAASNRAIAEALFISEATVKTHVRHIFAKLGVHSRTELLLAEQHRT